MAFWDQALHRPRTLRVRGWLLNAHLCVGLVAGMAATVVGVSGSVLIFRPEIEHALYAPKVRPQAQRAPLETMLTAVMAKLPDSHRMSRVELPASETDAAEFILSRKGARDLKDARQISVFADPYTGAVLSMREKQSGWIFPVQELHFSLMGGIQGLTLNGYFAILLLGLSCSGLVLWWQGMRNWTQGLKVKWSASWKRMSFDLHHAVGFFTSAALVALSATGIYYAFREPVTHAVLTATSSAAAPGSPKVTKAPPGTRKATLDEVAANTQAALPEHHVVSLRFPASPAFPYVASMGVRTHTNEGSDRVYLDPVMGTVLRVDKPAAFSTGAKVLDAMGPIHFGTIGGLPLRALWALAGLAPAVLFVSGLAMWWNRVVSKWLARRSEARQATAATV